METRTDRSLERVEMRKPLQGVTNIIRFNWPFYALSLMAVVTLVIFRLLISNNLLAIVADVAMVAVVLPIVISLLVSLYVYDLSGFYDLKWLDDVAEKKGEILVNINAGFDETSELLNKKFAGAELRVFDFYDAAKHTEPSIQRARKAYPAFPGTKVVATNELPMPDNSADKIFAVMSAHEIRDHAERADFFGEVQRVLRPAGDVIVVEHLRDAANLVAYNFGAFHFHSRPTWLKTFDAAGLIIESEKKITPFVTAFVLKKNGAKS